MSAIVEATCLCGRIQESLQLASSVPVEGYTCSCNSCRYCTGVLYLSALPLKIRPTFADKLQEYRSSSKVSRYFCGTCGSHVLLLLTKDSSWDLASGVVERLVGPQCLPMQLEQYTRHEFVGDTVDGGLTVCLAAFRGEKIPLFMQGPDEEPVTFVPGQRRSPFVSHSDVTEASAGQTEISTGTASPSSTKLLASCHCGGVQFNITRPTEGSSELSAPWPDLIVPSSSGHSNNPDDAKWWLRAGGSKFLAGTCACRSCRLESGVPIQTWTFVPKINIEQLSGSALDFKMGTLEQYISSPGCYREFCRTCGATIFWHCEERPELIDVSVGILRSLEGSRAEDWLEWWTDRVSFKEEAFDSKLASDLEIGLHVLKPTQSHCQFT